MPAGRGVGRIRPSKKGIHHAEDEAIGRSRSGQRPRSTLPAVAKGGCSRWSSPPGSVTTARSSNPSSMHTRPASQRGSASGPTTSSPTKTTATSAAGRCCVGEVSPHNARAARSALPTARSSQDTRCRSTSEPTRGATSSSDVSIGSSIGVASRCATRSTRSTTALAHSFLNHRLARRLIRQTGPNTNTGHVTNSC
jgi:hypothetical protein